MRDEAGRFRWPVVTILALFSLVIVAGLLLDPLVSDTQERQVSQPLRVLRGVAVAVFLALAVIALLRRQLFSLPLVGQEVPSAILDSDARRRHDAEWFVHLRWLAAAVALGLITCARPDTRGLLVVWWAGLLAANLAFEASVRRWHHYELQILVQAAIDLVILTGFLNASGGLESPLYTVYLFHPIVGRILLPGRKAIAVSLLAVVLFGLLAFGEYLHILPHYTNFFFPHLDAVPGSEAGHGGPAHGGSVHASYDLYFVLGRAVPFVAVLLLTDFFVASVMRRLRGSERGLEVAARLAMLERERVEGVVDAAGVGMMQVDAAIALRWFSGRIATWLGWDDRKLNGRCPLLDVPDGCDTCVVRATLETGQPEAAERREAGDKRGERFFRHSSSPIKDASGKVVQVVEVIEDVTAQRALEAEAIRAGKLSVLGRMAAGIAHEIGNPLSSLSTRVRLLERRKGEEPFVAESIGVLSTQIDRITRIVRNVSQFARVQPRDRTVWEANGLVAETMDVVRLDRRAKAIELRHALETPSPVVCGVRDQIGQILLNLVLNAVEATPDGGAALLSTAQQGAEVHFSVEDQGPGIDDETRSHLFEPFFTTKAEGTGLGLSISYGLAAAHGGRIEVEDLPERGSKFTLVLPVHDESSP